MVAYHHHNVIHHRYANNYHDYPWSSFSTLVSKDKTRLQRKEVFSWYGGLDEFLEYGEAYRKHRWEKENWYIEEID